VNGLPDARRAIHGRTHSRAWHAGDMDPIDRPSVSLTERAADVLLAIALGVLCAVGLVHWFAT